MVHQKMATFYLSKLVPDLFEHYVIVCGQSVYWLKLAQKQKTLFDKNLHGNEN